MTMAQSDPHEGPPPQSSDRTPPPPGPAHPPHSSPDQEGRDGEEHFFLIAEKFVGTAMIFVGFLNVLLSISGGYVINVVPFLLYCAGLAIWAHATIANQTMRYAVIGITLIVGLAFFHFGEVLFWHKQVVFWGTVVLVVFFMFKPEPK